MDVGLIIFLSIIIAAFGLIGFYNYREQKKLRPIEEKIETYRQQTGQLLMHEQEVPLTAEEAARVRSSLGWGTGVITLFLVVLIAGVAWFLISEAGLASNVYWVAAIAIVAMGFWLVKQIHRYRTMQEKIASGSKTIVRGIITKRYLDGDESTTYHLEIESIKLSVNKAVYDTYKLGDAAEFHIFKPYSNFVLNDNQLKGAGLNDPEED